MVRKSEAQYLKKTWHGMALARLTLEKKRYVVLSCFHTLSSRDRSAIQPRRKERSSAKYIYIYIYREREREREIERERSRVFDRRVDAE